MPTIEIIPPDGRIIKPKGASTLAGRLEALGVEEPHPLLSFGGYFLEITYKGGLPPGAKECLDSLKKYGAWVDY